MTCRPIPIPAFPKVLGTKPWTCQKSAVERGWKQREGHNFLRLRKRRGHEKWAVKRGRVMQIYARDNVKVHPQKIKEVLYLVKKKKKNKKNETLWI